MSDGPEAPAPDGRLPAVLRGTLALPVIAAPMFIVSGPDLVIAQCLAGVVGSFPALNARPAGVLDDWLTRITATLAEARAADPSKRIAPFAVNQIVHASNDRLAGDVEACVRHRVPIVITSLRAPDAVIRPVHAYGGVVFHDVTTVRHAEKALEAGVDGLILVCSGAGGHAGTLSPFALVSEVRRFYDGPLILSGAITTGSAILAAQAMGADLAYMGTRFIATREANAAPGYREMITGSSAADILYTPYFTGVPGNYLTPSIRASGLDPDALPVRDKTAMNFGSASVKAWRDVWGAGQGVGSIDDMPPVADLVARLARDYAAARAQTAGLSAGYAP
ncbi:nitronate monooxygenase family protein [Methylobacterium sp. NEAU 140]|uniref:NAD(P)H-dependent flavin oxidoreductase n=1 Tax=Methylobacterium sp. NEAU 140 TaxID=3064945 RepID=UPI002734B660|nr:nitronate monooxygenase family protein [Methylobacterium sp. NEAU 140]MDP4024723.1 nitronate monooxygenase family protein [Methylobacterium sp. NEAU 140]